MRKEARTVLGGDDVETFVGEGKREVAEINVVIRPSKIDVQPPGDAAFATAQMELARFWHFPRKDLTDDVAPDSDFEPQEVPEEEELGPGP